MSRKKPGTVKPAKRRPGRALQPTEMRAAPHGHGMLRTGNPGNIGGTGRPPSAIRARLRGSLDDRIATLEQIADDLVGKPEDRMRAIEILARYGLGTREEITLVSEDVRARVRAMVVTIRTRPQWESEELLRAIEPHWVAE